MAEGNVVTPFPKPNTCRWHEATKARCGFHIHYLPTLDMVSLTLGEPVPAYSIEGDDGMLFRINLTTHELVGVEIYDFRELFLPKHPEFRHAYGLFRLPGVRAVLNTLFRLPRADRLEQKIAVRTALATEAELEEALLAA